MWSATLCTQINYFDRLERMKKQMPRVRPLTNEWTAEKLKERYEMEMVEGQFGLGDVLPSIPLQQHHVEEIDEEEEASEREEAEVETEEVGRENDNVKVYIANDMFFLVQSIFKTPVG